MSARLSIVKQQLKALESEKAAAQDSKQGTTRSKINKQKRKGKRGSKIKTASELGDLAAGAAATHERSLQYYLATSKSDARVQGLMRKALGLPAPPTEEVEETDEDLLALFG